MLIEPIKDPDHNTDHYEIHIKESLEEVLEALSPHTALIRMLNGDYK